MKNPILINAILPGVICRLGQAFVHDVRPDYAGLTVVYGKRTTRLEYQMLYDFAERQDYCGLDEYIGRAVFRVTC